MRGALAFFSIVIVLICSEMGFAQVVEKVTGTRVIIKSTEIQLQIGDELVAIDGRSRRTGVVLIKQVRGLRAAGDITKGTVTDGETLLLKPNPKDDHRPEPIAGLLDRNGNPLPRQAIGIMLGMSWDTISFLASDPFVPPQHSENATMYGNSYKAKIFYDYLSKKSISYRFSGGIDGYNGTYTAQSKSINKDNSQNSTISLTTFAVDGEVMWNFKRESLNTYWVGGGYSIQYSLTTIDNLYTVQLNNYYSSMVFLGGGANIERSKDTFIPVYLHYKYYIAGSGISQSSIEIGSGFGWTF